MESRVSSVPLPVLRERDTPEAACENCGDTAVATFCPRCGQRKRVVRVSTRRILMDALDDQFSLNSALPRTLVSLFFRPGRLTREYLDGRIARHIPPFRLYLLSSVLFFLLLSLTAGGEWQAMLNDPDVTIGPTPEAPAAPTPPGEEVTSAPAASETATALTTEAEEMSWLEEMDVMTGNARLDRLIEARKTELAKMDRRVAIRQLLDGFMEQLPTAVFLLLPVFAVLLKLVYVRRGHFYVEHFVFALHVHAFVFLFFALFLVVPDGMWELPLVFWLFAYIYLAMRRVYGQGRLMTGAKYAVLGLGYSVLLSLTLVATAIVTLLVG